MAIATYTFDTLPAPERAALPPVEVITHALGGTTAPAEGWPVSGPSLGESRREEGGFQC